MWLFIIWWCVDDHIAAALNQPGVGKLAWWIPLLLGLAFSSTVSVSAGKKT
jgi:hypothetical protein